MLYKEIPDFASLPRLISVLPPWLPYKSTAMLQGHSMKPVPIKLKMFDEVLPVTRIHEITAALRNEHYSDGPAGADYV